MNKIQQYLNKSSFLAIILIISFTAKSFNGFGYTSELFFQKTNNHSPYFSQEKVSKLQFSNFILEENDNEEDDDNQEESTLTKGSLFEKTNSIEILNASKKASFLNYYLSLIKIKRSDLYLVFCSIKIPTQNSRV
jgi:hypothetical protein